MVLIENCCEEPLFHTIQKLYFEKQQLVASLFKIYLDVPTKALKSILIGDDSNHYTEN